MNIYNTIYPIYGGSVNQQAIPEDYRTNYDGIYIKGAQHLLKNYIEPYAHDKNCFSCSLRFLNIISPEVAEAYSRAAIATEHGISKKILEENLQQIFDDSTIKFQFSSDQIEDLTQSLSPSDINLSLDDIFVKKPILFRSALENKYEIIEYKREANETFGIKMMSSSVPTVSNLMDNDDYNNYPIHELFVNDEKIIFSNKQNLISKVSDYKDNTKNIKLVLRHPYLEAVERNIMKFNIHIKNILDVGCLSIALIQRRIEQPYHCILIGRSLNDNIYFLDGQHPYKYIENTENIIMYLLENDYKYLSLLISKNKSKCVESNLLETYNENPVFLTRTGSLFV